MFSRTPVLAYDWTLTCTTILHRNAPQHYDIGAIDFLRVLTRVKALCHFVKMFTKIGNSSIYN